MRVLCRCGGPEEEHSDRAFIACSHVRACPCPGWAPIPWDDDDAA